MFEKYKPKEFELLLKDLRNKVVTINGFVNAAVFWNKWETIFIKCFDNQHIRMTSPNEKDQVFHTFVSFEKSKIKLDFNIGVIRSLLNNHPAKMLKLDVSNFAPTGVITYNPTTTSTLWVKDESPIIVAPLALSRQAQAIVIDGNHRISSRIKYGKSYVNAYLLNELITQISLMTDLQRAVYLFITELYLIQQTHTDFEPFTHENMFYQLFAKDF